MRTQPTAIIETTVQGIIEWIDEDASQLLNISHRACRGRELLPWFAGDRHVIAEAIYRAAAGQDVQGETIIRPRDRKPVPVSFHVAFVGGRDRSVSPMDVFPPVAPSRRRAANARVKNATVTSFCLSSAALGAFLASLRLQQNDGDDEHRQR